MFIPKNGEDEPILTFIFGQMGWFNHQLFNLWPAYPARRWSLEVRFPRGHKPAAGGLIKANRLANIYANIRDTYRDTAFSQKIKRDTYRFTWDIF